MEQNNLTHVIPLEVASVGDMYNFIKAREKVKEGIIVKSETISSGVIIHEGTCVAYHVAYIEKACTKEEFDQYEVNAKRQQFANTLRKA